MLKRLALALILIIAATAPLRAGLEETSLCNDSCKDVVADVVSRYIEGHFPPLNHGAETFEQALAAPPNCPARSGAEPAVFGILIGPQYTGNLELKGPANDVQLFRQVMLDRGARPEFITTVTGDKSTLAAILGAMGKVLGCLRERDQVLLQFSIHSTLGNLDSFAFDWMVGSDCAATASDEEKAVCAMAAADPGKDQKAADAIDALRTEFKAAADGYEQLFLLDSDTRWNGDNGPDFASGISAPVISNFITRVRNRGADAFLILDANYAAAADILSLQRDAAVAPGWSADAATVLADAGMPDLRETQAAQGVVQLFGSGDFAAFYATAADKGAAEGNQNGQGIFGEFSFKMAEALRAEGRLTFRDIALAVSKEFEGEDWQQPEFQASNADLAFLAPRAEPLKAGATGIEIISPAAKRGASDVEEKSFTLVARYTGTAKAFKAIVDGDLVDIDNNGQFRKDITDTGGKFEIAIRVLSPEFETLAATALKIRDKPADDVVSVPGRRLALVIANDTYQDPAFPALKTPVADAKAIADILVKRFGFVTRIEQGGKPLDLMLSNVTKAQVQQVLFDLRRRLTAEDQLIVYYAGHGENDPDLGAYWVPVDGQPKADFTWIAADEITRELKRMNALSILVISDSCYAGGLSRGAANEVPAPDARDRYLAKASRLKSRQLMASGGDEPVADTGGGGHSVFAKALIDALNGMGDKTFTASELFEQKVKPAVISAADAASEGQTPGYHRISRAGDEPGSEFVFQLAVRSP